MPMPAIGRRSVVVIVWYTLIQQEIDAFSILSRVVLPLKSEDVIGKTRLKERVSSNWFFMDEDVASGSKQEVRSEAPKKGRRRRKEKKVVSSMLEDNSKKKGKVSRKKKEKKFDEYKLSDNRSETRDSKGAWYQREEMLSHDILGREEEMELGREMMRAKEVREAMVKLIEEKAFLSCAGFSIIDATSSSPYDITPQQHRQRHQRSSLLFSSSQTRRENKTPVIVRDANLLNPASFEPLLQSLTHQDITQTLRIAGGHTELRSILHRGSSARLSLMTHNIRLVVSIAKKFMRRSLSPSSSSSSPPPARLADLYAGSWDRPSLDEVCQEGLLGLARAVDKFDPERGLRLSTYSTHWVTSYVRRCLRDGITGSLKVPAQLHEIKKSYRKLLRKYYDNVKPIPSHDALAAEIGITPARLRLALTVTESLISIDAPVYGGKAMFKGSAASDGSNGGNAAGVGAGNSGDNILMISDTLMCQELKPEEHVDISFLRQSLESAMAAELSPHERDVLRLRLGLDDGKSRSVREVVEVCGGGLQAKDVRTTERRAFKKLRSPTTMTTHHLAEYLYMVGETDFSFYR